MIIRKNASFFIKDVFYKEKVVPLQLTNDYHQKDMIKLSVIIPIYNTPEPLLEHCISSIQENLQQMGDEVEVLLINDGSTVSHIEPMLKAAEAADNRFKYVYKENSGVSATRNLGIDMAQGEHITFVDADDYLEPDALQYMVETMDKIDAEIGFYGIVNDSSTVGHRNYTRYIKMLSEVERERVLINILSFIYGLEQRSQSIEHHAPWGKVFKKSHLDRYHIRFHTGLPYSEDSFFNFCYMTFAKKVYVDNKLTYHYVVHPASTNQKCSDGRVLCLPTLLDSWEKFILYNFPTNTYLMHLLSVRALREIQYCKSQYFTNPENTKSFKELKSEMNHFLYQPTIKKWIKEMSLFDAKSKIDLKHILLLKFHLYWIFLITERRKRKFYDT